MKISLAILITSRLFIITFFLGFTFSSFGQVQSNGLTSGKKFAENELKKALADTTFHYYFKTDPLFIETKETAINIAEPVLFNIYGKANITRQRPYQIYLIDDHWIIFGTLPKKRVGGTFLIIFDARNSEIIELKHGK